jgi:hypothetical protein
MHPRDPSAMQRLRQCIASDPPQRPARRGDFAAMGDLPRLRKKLFDFMGVTATF